MKIYKTIITIFFLSASVANGHVGLAYPNGGETFNAGDLINIKWFIIIDHGDCDWDLYFSSDGGSTWAAIENNISKAQLEYEWTVPGNLTDQAKVRIVQDNVVSAQYDAVSGNFAINSSTTGIVSDNSEVKDFFIYPAYPNPFNNSTVISFNLPEQDQVKITVFNIAGEEISTLINLEMPAGFHQFRWEADDVPSGVYFYAVETKRSLQTRKLILIK